MGSDVEVLTLTLPSWSGWRGVSHAGRSGRPWSSGSSQGDGAGVSSWMISPLR